MVDSFDLLEDQITFDNTGAIWVKDEAVSYFLVIAVPMTYFKCAGKDKSNQFN